MKSEGKFKLLSFFVENNLIFYNSLNKVKKIVAFSIIEIEDLEYIIKLLNNFLIKSPLNSYAIQIYVSTEQFRRVILSFVSSEKKEIVQAFNKICEALENDKIFCSIKKDEELKKEFLVILLNNTELDLKNVIVYLNIQIIIKDNKNSQSLNFYNINFNILEDKRNFISNFVNFLNDKDIQGHLILNCYSNNQEDIQNSLYFVEVEKEDKININLVAETNNFFKLDVLGKLKPDKDFIYKFLWRLPISNANANCLSNNIIAFFSSENMCEFQDLSKLKTEIEHSFSNHEINYIKLNENLLLLNNKTLFSIFSKLDLELLSRLINKYIEKYQIYALIVNKNEYIQFSEIKHISKIKNLKILNPDMFLNLNIEDLK